MKNFYNFYNIPYFFVFFTQKKKMCLSLLLSKITAKPKEATKPDIMKKGQTGSLQELRNKKRGKKW